MSIVQKIARRARMQVATMRRGERGNVAIMTGFTVVGMALMVGGTADVYRYESERRRVQSVFDRCVLTAARAGHDQASNLTGAAAETAIRDMAKACMTAQDVTPPPDANFTITDNQNDGIRGVTAFGEYPLETTFLRLANIDELSVGIESSAFDTEQYSEVSLVLDVSSSMRNSVGDDDARRRMDALKPAAKEFVRKLLRNNDPNDPATTINIVPYNQNVSIGQGMMDVLNIDRKHWYSSCVEFPMDRNSNSFVQGVPSSFSQFTQVTPYVNKWATEKHSRFGHEEDPRKSDNNYYYHENAWEGDYENRDTSKPRLQEWWHCPDDPHAYMVKPYEPRNVKAGDGKPNSATIALKIDGVIRTYPFYRDELYDHIVECENLMDRKKKDSGGRTAPIDSSADYEGYKRCEWNNGESEAAYMRPKNKSVWPRSERYGTRLYNEGHLRLDLGDHSITYMSTDEDELLAKIDALAPATGTATDYGVKWGYMLLHPDFNRYIRSASTGAAPAIRISPEARNRPRQFNLADPSQGVGGSNLFVPRSGTLTAEQQKARKTKKFLIILTDGDTYGRKWPDDEDMTKPNFAYDGEDVPEHNEASATAARNRVQSVCDEAKANGIRIYTIALSMDSESGRKALSDCAADSGGRSYVVGADLDAAFQEIAATIDRLRLVPVARVNGTGAGTGGDSGNYQ